MTPPIALSTFDPQRANSKPGIHQLALSVVAYASAISASVGAAVALVGAGVPLDILVAVV